MLKRIVFALGTRFALCVRSSRLARDRIIFIKIENGFCYNVARGGMVEGLSKQKGGYGYEITGDSGAGGAG